MTAAVVKGRPVRPAALGLAALLLLGVGAGVYRLRHVLGCPLTASGPREVARMRASVLPSLRGEGRAPARPAFGFAVGVTRRQDVDAWARSNAVACEPAAGGAVLRCRGAAGALADRTTPADAIVFAFTPEGTLNNASLLETGIEPAEATRALAEARARFGSRLGPATRVVDPSARESLEARGATVVIEYRFEDYLAEVTATNVGPGRVVVREHVMSLRD